MPYSKLIEMTKFSKLRLKQLWDDLRIFSAWYSSKKKGRIIHDKKTGRVLSFLDIIKRFAKARGLLWALGYSPSRPKKGKVTTPAYKELWKKAAPSIKYYYYKYKDKVQRG